jgi:hypothetical protein
MRARYSITPLKEIELSATSLEWQSFAFALHQNGSVIQCESASDPSPYPHSGKRVCVHHKTGEKVKFQVSSDGDVIVTGDHRLLSILSQNATTLGSSGWQDYHVHIEHLGEDHYVEKSSVPVVFLLRRHSNLQ